MRLSRLHKLFAAGLVLVLAYWMIDRCRPEKDIQRPEQDAFIARVGKQYLHLSDLDSMDLLPIHPADRTAFINQYAEEWACKQLLIAQGDCQAIQPSIEGKVHDYKNDLLAYHLLETLVQLQLDTHVSEEEVTDYYQKYKQNDFMLHHDIVKGIFLAIPKKANCINVVKSLMLSGKATDLEKLQKCCKPYSHRAILEPDKWFPWEAVVAKIGYHPPANATRLLKTNKFIHVASRKQIYFLKINQYKLAPEIAPLETVADQIKAIILHKRKLDLINKIKYKLLQDAKKNHTCVIQIK